MAKPPSYSPSTSSSPLRCASVTDPSARRLRTTETSRAKRRAPSAAVLAALATLVSAAPPPVDGAAITTGPTVVARRTTFKPDVPEFLCPAVLTQPSLHPLAASSSSANVHSATPSAAQTVAAPTPITRRQQQRQRQAYLSQDLIASEAVADCSGNSNFQDDRHGVATPVQTQAVTRATATTDADDESVHTSPTPASSNGRRKRRSITRSTAAPKLSSRTHTRGARPQSVSVLELKLHERRDSDGDGSQCTESFISRTIPDRYELGDDGRWHKLSVWSSCSLCDCDASDVDNESDSETSTTGMHSDASDDLEEDNTSEDPSIAASTGSSEASSSPVSLVLPDGWEARSTSAVYKVPLIVVASILIAAAVAFAVWFIFFWRRRRRSAKEESRARDLEKRKRLARDGSDSEDGMDEDEDENVGIGRLGERRRRENVMDDPGRRCQTPEGKGRKRWARGVKEWKAHVRWIHRRKRGRVGIVEGLRQRNDATASGVSLVTSLTSSQTTSRVPGLTVHGDNPDILRGEDRSIEPTLVVALGSEREGDSLSGNRIRTDGQDEGVLREAESSSEGRRPIRVQDQSSTRNYGRDGGEAVIRSRSRPQIDPNLPTLFSIAASNATLDSDLVMEGAGGSEAYDRPPPDILPVEREICADNDGDVEDEIQGPPAYRPRRSVDGGYIQARNVRTRMRRDEKRASAPRYVPAPEDCVPYSSGDEDSENDCEGRITMQRNADRLETNMHVAVDDKHALAQLAAYASAPPSSSSLPVSSSPSFDPTGAGSSILFANVPPEPEWLYDYSFSDDDAVGDSPGAGPGPSTVSARSASPSPSSSHCHSPSRPVDSRGRLTPSFPAPPTPVSSQLVYAPADAGLLVPSLESTSSLGASPGFREDFDAEFGDSGAPSAPPFDEYAVGAPPLEGNEDDVLAGASAPPLFPEDETEEGGLYEYASAPPVGSADTTCPTEVTSAELGNDRSRGIAYSAEESASEVPAELSHAESSDRNAVPSAVR